MDIKIIKLCINIRALKIALIFIILNNNPSYKAVYLIQSNMHRMIKAAIFVLKHLK